jgi:hypothetical protein
MTDFSLEHPNFLARNSVVIPVSERLDEGRERRNRPLVDSRPGGSLPPSRPGPLLTVRPGLPGRPQALAREPEKRRGGTETEPTGGSVLPSSGEVGKGAVRWAVVWSYVLVLMVSYTVGRLAGMGWGQVGLFMFIGFCGTAGWVRERLRRG